MEHQQEEYGADKDTDYILHLLDEYTEKLRFRAEMLSRARLLGWLVAITTVGVAGVMIAVILTMSSPLSKDARFGLASVCTLLMLAAGALLWRQTKRRALFEQDAIMSSLIGLNRLVRRGSQMEDHGNVDFTKRIALELRVAEAEVAIQQAARQLPGSDRKVIEGA